MNELFCPICKTKHVFMYDYQPLFTPDKYESNQQVNVDNELYAMFKCDNGHEFNLTGKITFENE